ncbi:MAG: UxaA family hydrolase [Geminicoccaceae bacterium]
MIGAGAVRLNERDTVATALRDLPAGVELTIGDVRIVTLEAIPAFHKLALADLAEGTLVKKYGQVIGRLTGDVRSGALVHVHNLVSCRGC